MSSLTPEAEILKPLRPDHLAEKYEYQWPQFNLKNAIVTDKAGVIINLFTATEQNLLIVSGELQQRRDQSSHCQFI
jgi:hypothetical protein